MSVRFTILAATLAACFGLARPGAAVVFNVDSTKDEVDVAIDGACASASGACTLRAAVQEAEATTDADVIEVPAGKYALKRVGIFEDSSETGDLDITENLTINGAGPGLTVIQGKKDRVFDIFGEPAPTVAINGLTISKGAVLTKLESPPEEPEGGGISIAPDVVVTLTDVVVSGNKCGDDGGGISNFGNLTLTRVTIEKNKSNDDAGGIYNAGLGVATLDQVTIAKNSAKDEGGAIENQAELVLANVTLSANKAKVDGGAINNDLGTVTLTNVTVKGNKSGTKSEAGGLTQQDGSGPFTLRNVILDGNKPFNCDGAFTAEGGNLESGNTCGLPLDASDFGKTLGLAKLQDNGGGTPTHALEPESPAVDFGVDANCPAADQRGVARVDVPGVGTSVCDSGAYELEP